MLFHKNCNRQIQVYTIQQHLELERPVKLMKHVVSFIRKELAEDCLQVPVTSIAELKLLTLRNM